MQAAFPLCESVLSSMTYSFQCMDHPKLFKFMTVYVILVAVVNMTVLLPSFSDTSLLGYNTATAFEY